AVAPSIQEPVEVPLRPRGPLAGWRSEPHAVLVLVHGERDHLAPIARVLDAERPLDVGGAVPLELLVEEPGLREHLATEGHQVTLDRIARAGAGRLVELAQVGGDDAERAADTDRPIRERLLERPEHVPRRFDRTVHRQHDAAARTPEAGVACDRPPG